MQKKVLTISIASYNTEKFIQDTVQSLVIDNVYMQKVEIIIVNDGSKDKTSEIAHSFERQYPGSIIVIDKANGGYGSTINASLQIATGKYYKLLDGDDWFITKNLIGFIDYLEDCDSDIVITPYVEVRTDDKMIDVHKELFPESEFLEKLNLNNKFFAMHEIAIRTDALRGIGKTIAEHCFYTDSEFVFYCIMAANTIARYDQPIYRYRLGVDGQSVSLQGIRKHYQDLPIVSKRIIEVYSKWLPKMYGAKKEIASFCVQSITYHTFEAIMMMEHPKQYREELLSFDKEIKDRYPEAYKVGNGSTLVKTTRMLKFRLYNLLCRIMVHKFEMSNG